MTPIPCYRCDGSGQVLRAEWHDMRAGSLPMYHSRPCPDCLGKRVLYREEVVIEVAEPTSTKGDD